MAADFAGGDAQILVAENVGLEYMLSVTVTKASAPKTYRNDVEDAKDKHDDRGTQDNAPVGKTQSLLAHRLLVHIAQDVDAEDDHCKAKRTEAMIRTKERPVAVIVGPEESHFGDSKEDYLCELRNSSWSLAILTANRERDDMANCIEEKELWQLVCPGTSVRSRGEGSP